MARYAITDIHGCAQTFGRLLTRLQLQNTDQLFLLGDYIDRGPDSYGVLSIIWRMVHKGYQVTCLRGNHEQLLLDALAGKGEPYDYLPPREERDAIAAWINAMPFYHETPGYLLVHAGLNFNADDPLEDRDSMLWARHWEAEINRPWLGDRILVYGHTPAPMATVRESAETMRKTQLICLDSGCAMPGAGYGYLTALNLDTGEATFERYAE